MAKLGIYLHRLKKFRLDAASIAQTHRATLKNGDEVVIKLNENTSMKR